MGHGNRKFSAEPKLGDQEPVERTQEQINDLMESVTAFALSDLRHRTRLAMVWGLTRRGAVGCIDQAIREWEKEEKDAGRKTAEPSNGSSLRESTKES